AIKRTKITLLRIKFNIIKTTKIISQHGMLDITKGTRNISMRKIARNIKRRVRKSLQDLVLTVAHRFQNEQGNTVQNAKRNTTSSLQSSACKSTVWKRNWVRKSSECAI